MTKLERPDVVVPENAADRGPIMTGELRSKDKLYPQMLAQFSKIYPHTKSARIYLFPTVEQAKLLYGCSGPFSFEAVCSPRVDVSESHKADGIWLKSASQVVNYEAVYWTQTSGRVDTLNIKTIYLKSLEQESGNTSSSAWFVADHCLTLQIIANASKKELEAAVEFGFERTGINLILSNGTLASVHRYVRLHRFGAIREIKRNGYAITISGAINPEITKRDVDVLLILASFASRERTLNTHWSIQTKEDLTRNWRFNYSKSPRRADREDPLILRDREEHYTFSQAAFNVYCNSRHQALLESAIYALLHNNLTIELQIAHLFSGIQGALTFAMQPKLKAKRLPIGELYRRFIKAHPGSFEELWPL